MVKRSAPDRVFDGIVVVALIFIGLFALVPLLVVVSASLTPYSEVLANGGYVLFPTSFTLEGYIAMWNTTQIPRAMLVSTFVTVVGTALNMVLSTGLAWPLSRKEMPGRSFILLALVFTTVFNAGIIPTYLIVKETGLLNSIWAMIIPSALSVFNVFIMKTFFEGLPSELSESARLDGAGELRLLLQIIFPLAVPVLLTIGLFYAVANWNTFFAAIFYVRDASLQPLQVVLRDLLTSNIEAAFDPDEVTPALTLRMAAVVITALPMIIVYPFIQKHFQKGVLIGSVKS
ncbi:MAG TPA: carbohydrate ABC transporter permease [Candidatus Ruania gallistercoris]|uniref:Carbohydrate ABC transporter permease n=1 Tax=Candidatus Ruania gallistercoris TaxID=2838746 RepID=A0A9D2J5W6_9MICO|nr:carbohydrate ABC transporter permease [Candidatus Ruania gallistercoris]